MNSLLPVERHTNNNNHNSSTKYDCLRIASPSIALNKRFRLGRPWTYMLPKDQCMRYVNLYILIMLRCEEKWNISFFFHHSFHHSLLVWCVCGVPCAFINSLFHRTCFNFYHCNNISIFDAKTYEKENISRASFSRTHQIKQQAIIKWMRTTISALAIDDSRQHL